MDLEGPENLHEPNHSELDDSEFQTVAEETTKLLLDIVDRKIQNGYRSEPRKRPPISGHITEDLILHGEKGITKIGIRRWDHPGEGGDPIVSIVIGSPESFESTEYYIDQTPEGLGMRQFLRTSDHFMPPASLDEAGEWLSKRVEAEEFAEKEGLASVSEKEAKDLIKLIEQAEVNQDD